MVKYHDIQDFKSSRVVLGREVTVVVRVPADGNPPYPCEVIFSGDKREWSQDDPHRPSYEPLGDVMLDRDQAFAAGFEYAEKLIRDGRV